MPNNAQLWGTSLASTRNVPGRFNTYVGSNTDRQRRFEARSARRWGDWFILDVPAPLLWLEADYLADVVETAASGDEVILELWP